MDAKFYKPAIGSTVTDRPNATFIDDLLFNVMTPKDREQLMILNGTAAPRSRDSYKTASSESGPWRQSPTLILPSGNAPSNVSGMSPKRLLKKSSDIRQPHPLLFHQSGTNPYGANPNRREIGNPTSSRVLSMSNDLHTRKKVKTEHTPASGGPHTRKGDHNNIFTRSKRTHEIPIAEPIDVDDYIIMPGDNSHTSIGTSSPDELNIRSPSAEGANYPSKYRFDTPSHGSTARNNNPPIAPDGENTEWAKKTFSQGFAQPSQVKEEIAKIEAKIRVGNQPKAVDLKAQLKLRDKKKDRMKRKNNKFVPRQPQLESSQVPARKKILPLKELYLDETHYRGNLEILWQPNDKISIKSDKAAIFGPLDIRSNVDTLTYHNVPYPPTGQDPIFQLKTIPGGGKFGSSIKCVTVKVDCSSPGAEDHYYEGLLDWLKTRINNTETVRVSASKSLWDSVAWAEKPELELSTNQGDSGQSRIDMLREGESQRARRSLINDRSKPMPPQKRSASQSSMGITPPPSPSATVFDNQKPKQRSRQDTSELAVVPRRSTRNMSNVTRSPALDSDEVILVYPPGVPGAVNITNGDFLRLRPEEFLNDTLIEFGLKLWLKDLEQTEPVLASQIHVFNSFFYKKLNHQKKGSTNLGYESVKKWTSKFDIFQKKYIIVPINEHLHWYFAIICDPECMLVPTTPHIPPSTRKQTRQSVSESTITDKPNETPIPSNPISTSVSENGKDEEKLKTPSETEVEDALHYFQGSCSISNIEPGENVTDLEGERSPSALSYVSDDGVLRPLSSTASDHERALLRHSPSDENMVMDSDLPANLQTTNHDDPTFEIHPRPVDAARFYQPAPPKRDTGKRKADPQPESFVMEIDDDDDNDGGSALGDTDTPKTYIFTFDSLGGRHPQAIKRLSAYLKMEAQDKKNILNTGNAEGRTVSVPAQPNFCDCGIYLLHFAQTFMSDPVHYRRLILGQKSKAVPDLERKVAWHDHRVAEKREDLRARIIKLSEEWKKERAAKEEVKHKEDSHNVEVIESSDCEIDILEPTPSASKAKSGGKRKSGQGRIRG